MLYRKTGNYPAMNTSLDRLAGSTVLTVDAGISPLRFSRDNVLNAVRVAVGECNIAGLHQNTIRGLANHIYDQLLAYEKSSR